MLNRQYLVFILSIFLLLGLGGCSQQVIDEINRIINANFGGYTKSDPLRVYVSPFKPHSEWEESEIGKIAWQGAVDGTRDVAFFSDGKVVFVGPRTRGYHGVDEEAYNSALERDDFWTTKGGSVKKRLKRLASSRNANSIIYGIYDGDDSKLQLSVYLYAKVDDIILKEYQEIQAQFGAVKSLREGKQSGRTLTKAEKELQKMIHEKVKFSTAKLLRKYMEGR
ncbi:membrane or secreted protein [Beggiatoa sp. PS]|nr:membrane or secreted protein [Beggiatoa sp. PS]